MTISETGALDAIRGHHQALTEQLQARVTALTDAVAGARPHEAAAGGLVAYLAGEILPHAAAEEQTIYRAAAALSGLAPTVAEMTAEHAVLAGAAERLASAADAIAAAGQARQIAALFTAHVARENDVLLPALRDDPGTDLAALLAEMHRRTEQASDAQAGDAPASNGTSPADDPLATVLSLLLQAASALARAGQADRACRLAASAWAALHPARPDLAVKVTAALHGLTRRVASPTEAAGPAGQDGAATPRTACAEAGDSDLDVRDLPPAQRHETIFAAYHALAPGAGFVLINDHDPKPLRYQFEAEHSGEFTWDSLEAGPAVWRVRIGRPPAGTGPAARPEAAATGAEPELDVRVVEHWKRHDLIFTAYQGLAAGAGFVLVNDHDPLPLRYQFESQYPGRFSWDYLQAGPDIWRVRIGRAGSAA